MLGHHQSTLSQEEYMSAELKEKAAAGLKTTCRGTWSLTVNTARRVKILGRYGLAYWQQRKINRALNKLGTKTFGALEQGEGNPMTAPEVNEAVQRAKELKEIKEKNYQAMEAIRERIRTSRVKEPPPPPPPSEAPPAEAKEAEKTEEAEKPQEPPAQ
jgi:outer membrane biosynthesis protein TonB